MGLESATFISQLVASNPVGGVDDYATADDHLRLIKAVLKAQFPNFDAVAVNATPAELNILAGAAAGGLTAAELLFVADVTSAIQAQLDGKSATGHGHTLADVSDSGALAALNTVDTAQIVDDAVTLAKFQDVITDIFLGRSTAGTGTLELLTSGMARSIINVEDGATADQSAGEIEAIVNHDSLLGFVSEEHLRWDLTGAENIHVDRLPPQDFFKTALEQVTSSVTLQDDNHLTGIPLTAGKTYKVEGHLFYDQNVGDFKWKFVFTNALQNGLEIYRYSDSFTTAGQDAGVWTVTFQITDTFDTDNTVVKFSGFMKANATTGGTFKLQWAQGTSSANPTTLQAGTYITVTPLD